VCCVYENGTMKIVTNSDGSRSVYVISGTSFATPQVAGAIALLRGAFPNLTGTQAVDLLLRTANDAGATGTDPIYGRGIMNIGAAFAPQGSTALAGSTLAMSLDDTTVVTSGAMGDAFKRVPALSAVVLDAYQRAYTIDLGQRVSGANVPLRLGAALTQQTRNLGTGTGGVAMAFTVDARDRTQRLAWSGPLRLSPAEAEASRVLAARMVADLAPGTRMALGFAQGADGLTAQLQGAARPAFLVARSPLDDLGFVRSGESSVAIRHEFGPWGASFSFERGSALSGAPMQIAGSGPARMVDAPTRRLGISFDRRIAAAQASLGASWLAEDRTVLGARLHPGFGTVGADSLVLDAAAGWDSGRGWHLGAALRGVATRARGGGALLSSSRFVSSAWAIDALRDNVFTDGDSLGLRLAQPLRVEQGGLSFYLPVEYSYSTLAASYAARTVPLSPTGRELDAELVWRGYLWGGAASASLYYRKDPGHYAALPDDHGLAMTWVRRF
jgi:hypothetical protein